MKSAPLLDVVNLSIAFGHHQAVKNISFQIHPGEVLGLVGESGSGKSATSLALLRLLPDTAQVTGNIAFAGEDLLTLPAESMRRHRGRNIAMIFQEPMTALNPVMPIGAQIAETIQTHHPELSRKLLKAKALEAMQEVALPDPEKRYRDYPHQFSGGQRQRILIAMAIVNRPRLLIADEPTTALDVTVQAQVLELIRGLRDRLSLGLIFVSHDIAVVRQVCDDIAIMYAGRIVESGPTADVLEQPFHPYTRALLGAVVDLDDAVDEAVPIPGTLPDPARLPAGCPFHPRCPAAQTRCSVERPVLTEIVPGRQVACHFPRNLATVTRNP